MHALLAASGHEFGHRVMAESLRFAAIYAGSGTTDLDEVLDLIAMQKLLPRLHGSRRRLEPVLRGLMSWAGAEDAADGRRAYRRRRACPAAAHGRKAAPDAGLSPSQPVRQLHRVGVKVASTVDLPLRDVNGSSVGVLSISALPRSRRRLKTGPTIPPARAVSRQFSCARQRPIATCSICRRIGAVRLEPAELFDPDDSSGRAGRLNTRQYVGDIWLTAFDAGGERTWRLALVLVKAAKLEHEREYQRMLREIADLAAEAVLQGFAPATTATAIVVVESAATAVPAVRDPSGAPCGPGASGRDRRGDPQTATRMGSRDRMAAARTAAAGRERRRSGSDYAWADECERRVQIGSLNTLPSTIAEPPNARRHSTRSPNRFVKFALTHWRELAARLGDILSSRATAAYGVRGTTAVARVIETLDDVLSEPFFRQVGRLQELPTSNQVLLKREGYRQIFSTFALIESSLDLSLELDDAVHPSQRNIATLYEYWTFLKLVEVLGDACDDSHALLRLFERDGDGLSLGLKRGRQSKLQWRVAIAGRRLAR